uniref:t-SNARE coiled-coil homology domain-containing protein n=1 Tax=Romanomermis culicivorax TaxID=13658 RepID=A0A915JFB7_ROMCU
MGKSSSSNDLMASTSEDKENQNKPGDIKIVNKKNSRHGVKKVGQELKKVGHDLKKVDHELERAGHELKKAGQNLQQLRITPRLALDPAQTRTTRPERVHHPPRRACRSLLKRPRGQLWSRDEIDDYAVTSQGAGIYYLLELTNIHMNLRPTKYHLSTVLTVLKKLS